MKTPFLILILALFVQQSYADNCSQERVEFGNKVEKANGVLKSSYTPETLPRPQPSEYNCLGSTKMAARDFEQNHQAEIFNMQLNNPELEALGALQASESASVACGFNNEYKDIVRNLTVRMNEKANSLARLIQQEKNYAQYQGAITTILATGFQRELKGDGDGSFAKYQAKMMSLELVEFALLELKNAHDFAYDLTAILRLAHVAIELGGTTTDDIIKKVERLMRFNLEVNGDVEVEIDGDQISYHTKILTPLFSGIYNLDQFRFDYQPNPAEFSFKGQLDFDDGQGVVTPNQHKAPVNIEIKACELIPIVKIKLLKFGPPREQWKLCADGECNSFPVPTTMQSLVHMALEGQYRTEAHESGDPWYVFEILPFNNKNAVLGERTFEGRKLLDEMIIDAEYFFKIQHQP